MMRCSWLYELRLHGIVLVGKVLEGPADNNLGETGVADVELSVL